MYTVDDIRLVAQGEIRKWLIVNFPISLIEKEFLIYCILKKANPLYHYCFLRSNNVLL